jgi:NAD(P)-dependent dehydrogenase (short-subunit alcohol dehydrogenase family)
MAWHPPRLGQQTGRTFVVTGANSGIGLEVARELVERDAHVVLAVRDTPKGEQAAARVVGPGATSVVELDLSDLDQVPGCAMTLLDRHDNLSALICNAGVMGGPFQLTPQGFERQMATNHLGQAALVAALWPLLHRRCDKGGSPVSAVAVHPGASATNPFARQLERAGQVSGWCAARRRSVNPLSARPGSAPIR